MKKLIIFGAGDIAQLAKYYFDIDSDYTVVAFTVDENFIKSDQFEGLPLVAFEQIVDKYSPADHALFIAVSYSKMNTFRQQKYLESKDKGYKLATYLSTKCSYLSQFPLGDNCFILEDNTIQPYVEIGSNITLWSGNHIGHHSRIESHNFISSHVVISGHCTVKSNCFLGVNSTVHNNVIIENGCLIGAGAVVTKNTLPKQVILPARSIVFDKNSEELGF